MKPTPSCSPSRLAEGGAPPRIVGGDLVGAACRTEPPHAVRQPRRGEPHLSVAKPRAELPQHGTLGDPQPVQPHHRVAAGHEMVQRIEHPLDVNSRRVHRCEEHRRTVGPQRVAVVLRHDDRERRTDRTGDQPFGAVDDEIRAVAARRRAQHRGVGAGPRRGLGHHEARADLAGGERAQPILLLALLSDRFEEMHVGFVRGSAIQGYGPERRIAGRLEDDGLSGVKIIRASPTSGIRRRCPPAEPVRSVPRKAKSHQRRAPRAADRPRRALRIVARIEPSVTADAPNRTILRSFRRSAARSCTWHNAAIPHHRLVTLARRS